MISAPDLLGVGLYSASEAALYAGVTPQLMSRWIHGSKKGASVVEPQIRDGDEKIVTFLDFIQALAIHRIRNERPKISLNTIREAYFRAKKDFRVDYPFALDSTRIGLFGPPDDPQRQVIWLCIGQDEEGVRQYFQLTGKKSKNQLFGEVVRTYTNRLVFDEHTRLAKRYIPLRMPDGTSIAMDPEVRFGEPYVESSGYTARTLFDAYRSEGTPERAAEVYGVSREEVAIAIEYMNSLNKSVAA